MTLTLFSIFVIFGNLLRWINYPVFQNNLLLSEAVLYLSAFLAWLSFKKSVSQTKALLIFALIVLGSTFYGVILHGLQMAPILYAIRLVAIVFSGIVIGQLLFQKYGNSLNECFHHFIKMYAWGAIAGLTIFAFFPFAAVFWSNLAKIGIVFHGDPHIGRFVSSYLDPNFYSAIGIIPLLLSTHLYKHTKQPKYAFAALLFFFTILLTWSRSGLATLGILLGIFFLKKLLFAKIWRINPSITILFILGLVAALIASRDQLLFFWYRLIYMNFDESAIARFDNLREGWDLFTDYPLLGIGYNFLVTDKFDATFNSSLMMTLIDFGLLATMGGLLAFIIWSYKQFNRSPIFNQLYLYLLVSILFTSQFNNLLYYPFWLLPMIALFSYLNHVHFALLIKAPRIDLATTPSLQP